MFDIKNARVALACLLLLASRAPAMAAAPAPPAPPPGPVPIAHFVSDDTYANPVLSPDGKHVAVTTSLASWFSRVPTLAIFRLEDMKLITALQLQRFEVPAQHWWVSNTRLVVSVARDFGDNEKPTPTGELLTVELDGKGQQYLYGMVRRETRDRGFGSVAGLPNKLNAHFYLGEYRYDSESSALYDVDAVTGRRELVLELPFPGLRMVFDHQEQARFALGATRDGRAVFLKFDSNTATWEPDRAVTKELRVYPQGFTADNSAFYAYVDETGKPTWLARQDAGSGARTVVAQDGVADIKLVSAGRHSTQAFGWIKTAGIPQLNYLDPGSGLAKLHKRLADQFPDSLVSLLNSTHDGSKVLFKVNSDRNPGSFYVYDGAANNAELLFTTLENIDPERMGERKPVSFTSRDGVELNGFLTLPHGLAPSALPLVLLPHGGPHGIADEWFFDPDAQFLASRGYAVLQVNFRGSGGRGADFIKSGYREWGGKIQDDLVDGVQWAIAQGVADKERVCVFGASFGAYSAMMLPTRAPQLFKCAAGFAGVYDLEMLMRDATKKDNKGRGEILRTYLGTDAQQLRRNSPTALADQIKVPVLLIHGGADDVTPLAHGKAMRSALREAGNEPEYMQVSMEGHGFYLAKNKLKVYSMLEEFLGRHIGRPQAKK